MTIFKGVIETKTLNDGETKKAVGIFDVLYGYASDKEISKFVNDINNGNAPENISSEDFCIEAHNTDDPKLWIIEIEVYSDVTFYVYNIRE